MACPKNIVLTTTFIFILIFTLRRATCTLLLSDPSTLDLETSRPSPATSLLKLPSLALHVWLFVTVGSESEMLHSLSGVLGSSEEKCVCACGRPHGQLINGQALSTSLLDPSTCSGGESESSDVELGNCEKTVVVCNGADYNDRLVLVGFCGSLCGCF